MTRSIIVTTLLLAATSAGCSRGQKAPDPPESPAADAMTGTAAAGDSVAATPVHMATVTRGNLAEIVSGPGRTEALDVQKVRAPFIGTLAALDVVIGDQVESGQVVGAVISQASQSALAGAEVMLRAATTPLQRSDAERAVELAKQNLVQAPLHAPRAGIVVSRGASQGDLLSQGDSIISVATANSIVFVARVAQSDVARIKPGQRATIEAPGRAVAAAGTVHGLLPADTSAMSVPVRIDLLPSAGAMPIGLFGMAHITVDQRTGVTIVPASAVLRDDINGITRMAVVAADGRAHWVTASVGIQRGDAVEITSPVLQPGTRVILSGQVGLPEGSHVREVSADSSSKKSPAKP